MNKLKKYLKHRTISQRSFCKKIGVTPNTLSSLINGKSLPSLTLAYEIEKKTGGLVTIYDWLPDDVRKDDSEIESFSQ